MTTSFVNAHAAEFEKPISFTAFSAGFSRKKIGDIERQARGPGVS